MQPVWMSSVLPLLFCGLVERQGFGECAGGGGAGGEGEGEGFVEFVDGRNHIQ